MVDQFIADDNVQLVHVFSQRIQKVKESKVEKASEIMMCVLFNLSDKPKMLTFFDWFLKQAKIPEENLNLNICITFKTQNLVDLCRYDQNKFVINSDSRNSLKEITHRAETFQWDMAYDQKSYSTIEQVIVDWRLPGIYKFTENLK